MESVVVRADATKKEKYEELLPQIAALLEGESDLIANLANIAAALKQTMGFFWVGFYLVKKPLPLARGKGNASSAESPGELVLGPFQGPVACTRIAYGRGVCGQAWARQKTLVVPDVDQFPGHIACSSLSRSEIVVPFYLQPELEGEARKIMGVLDVDSDRLAEFDEVDERYLTRILALLARQG